SSRHVSSFRGSARRELKRKATPWPKSGIQFRDGSESHRPTYRHGDSRVAYGRSTQAALSLRLTLAEAAATVVGAVALAGLLVAADRAGLWGHGRVPYSNGGGCDIWFYFTQIISPQAGHLLAEGTRFVARPLYVTPPHALMVLFPALDPNQAAFLFFLPLAVTALYLGLRALFGRATSASGAMLIGTAPLLVNMASGTYVPMGA